MTSRALVPLVVVASCGAPPPEFVRPPAQHGIDASGVNRSVDPCTDFYEYANGAWRAANPIPATKQRWGRRDVTREANKQRLRALLEELAARSDWPAGSPEQLAGDHYASCMNEPAIEAAGLSPIAPLIAEIDAATTIADVQRLIRRLHDLGIAAAFGETGAYDNSTPRDFRLNLVAGRHPEKAALAGSDRAIALDKRLAEASLDAATAADPAATEHRTTFAELASLTPHLDWATYFDEARLPRAPVNIAEPKLLRQVDHELATTPVAVWAEYLRWQLLDAASPWLAKADPTRPRAERCAESTEALLGEAIGRIYVARYFPPAAKAKAREIANGLLAVMKDELAASPWLTAGTRKVALDKLESMSIEIGYPDRWQELPAIAIRRDALWANVAQAWRFQVDDVRRQVGKSTDRTRWQLPPSSSLAYIDLQLNVLVLPAGFLQPPYFDLAATDAANYGALGAGLAHDMTHAFDATGARLDAQGRPQPWWTDADRKAFATRTQCIVDQYEGYAIEPGVHHRGALVLDEALGDQAGLHFAYRALERSMATHPVPAVDGFTPAQQFFLAWGQFRGEAMRIELQRQIVKDDPHAVPRFRVIGPVSNLPAFERAFACRPGAPMVRPREQRCAVW